MLGVKGIDRVSSIKLKGTGNSDSPRSRRITMSERDMLVSSNPQPVSQFNPITGELIMSSANVNFSGIAPVVSDKLTDLENDKVNVGKDKTSKHKLVDLEKDKKTLVKKSAAVAEKLDVVVDKASAKKSASVVVQDKDNVTAPANEPTFVVVQDKAAVVAPVIEKVPVATESDKESEPVVVADVKASVVAAIEKDNPKVTSKVSDESVKAPSVVADKPSSVVADKVDVVKDNINVVADKVVKENVLSVVADKASNINVVVVLNHEESFRAAESKSKHFFLTGCISKSMFNGTLASFDAKWESFSNQVNAQFKGKKSGLALGGIDLVFFSICKSEHFYEVVFSLTKTTTMTILDNSPGTYDSKYKEVCDIVRKTKENFHDCGIFTMLHMETFDGGPASNLDCGLPVESQLQRDMLRRLRFKFTTKILLHEINVHARKMLELAKKFDKTDPDFPGRLVKHKKKSSKRNEVLQPKPSRNTKSSVRRISKEVIKPKGAPVKSNVGKRKRLVEDKEVETDVEGNKSEKADESKKDNESEEAEEIEEDKKSEVAKEVVKDVKTKVVKGLRSRTLPSSLFAAIRDSQVDMESFLLNIGFSSLHNVYIVTLPQRFARFVVRAFSASSYEFKLEKGIIRVTPEKAFLLLLYLELNQFSVIHQRSAIRNWTLTAMNRRHELEIQDQVISKLDLHWEWTESELHQTEGFYDVGENVSRIRTSSVPPTDKKSFCSMIAKKISTISAENIALEDFLKRANAEFSNDEKVIELYDFDNNDNDGGGKNDVHGSDNVGKKKESVAKDVVNAKKDGVNAEKDAMNAVQEGEADVNEEPEDMLDEETFTQWIEKIWIGLEDLLVWPRAVQLISVVYHQTPQRVVTRSSPNKRIVKPPTYLTSPYMNKRTKVTFLIKRLEFVLGNSLFAMQGDKYEIVFQTHSGHESSVRLKMETLAPRLWIDANVIDCWTKAIIEWTFDEEQQWKVFSDEISTQFEHDVTSSSLSGVDLLKWSTTKNHSDCGVFTMIHLEHYFGKPVGQWDFGLCKESDEHDSMLRRMRFKIATKILLHEFNVHVEKMFDLAFKFESENDKQTRISIIVNAIKIMDERDPAKTKTFVENHKEDALKNK
nr:hypothetical protein [Tanacetum cinerariifolium]